MTDAQVNELADPPEVCAARAVDPVWVAAQADKRAAASARFIQRRADLGQPITQKKAGERF